MYTLYTETTVLLVLYYTLRSRIFMDPSLHVRLAISKDWLSLFPSSFHISCQWAPWFSSRILCQQQRSCWWLSPKCQEEKIHQQEPGLGWRQEMLLIADLTWRNSWALQRWEAMLSHSLNFSSSVKTWLKKIPTWRKQRTSSGWNPSYWIKPEWSCLHLRSSTWPRQRLERSGVPDISCQLWGRWRSWGSSWELPPGCWSPSWDLVI